MKLRVEVFRKVKLASFVHQEGFDTPQLVYEANSFLRPHHEGGGRQGIRKLGIGAKDCGATHATNGISRPWIEDVGVTDAVDLEEALVVARGRDGSVRKL